MKLSFKTLCTLAVLPSLFFATGRTAEASHDEFSVVVEIVSFKSLVDMDPSNSSDEYYLNLTADVPGAGSKSTGTFANPGAPKKILNVGRRITFREVREPDRDNQTIRLYADVSEQDVIKEKVLVPPKLGKKPILGRPLPKVWKTISKTVYADMGAVNRSTLKKLFREADRSHDDTASETVILSNSKYRMVVRVTVTEID